MSYKGVIIVESLKDRSILEKLKIINTKIIPVTEKHQTPWVLQWTLYTVEISDQQVEEIANDMSKALDSQHTWYADFKNQTNHYIIFRNKVFIVERDKPEQYQQARDYGISLGIPEYQLDFSPEVD